MQEFIEYVLDPIWVKKHCVQGFIASDIINDSLLSSYNQALVNDCCAPNEYLDQNQELLIDENNECLLLELFQKYPSNNALQLIEKTASMHPNFAASVVQKSIMDLNRLSNNFRSSIKSLLSYDFPVLSSVIVQELAECTCENTIPIVAAKFLVDWLDTTSVPNETLFIVSKYFIASRPNSNSVTRISNYLNDTRFSDVIELVEEEFLTTIAQGKLFQPLVFENFQNIINSGRMNPFTVGFLAYATKYEMYLPSLEAFGWFKFLLENSMEYVREDVLKADQMQEKQALLALDALSSIAVLELKNHQTNLSFVSEIVKYIIENEYKFVQSKYRLKWVFHNLFEIWGKDIEQDKLLPIMIQIVNHDEMIAKESLDQLGLDVTVTKNLPKDIDTLLKELHELNQKNPTIDQEAILNLISYVNVTLKEIKSKHREFGFDKYRRIIIHENYKKPVEIRKNEVHLYQKEEKFFLRIIDDNNMLLDFKANLDADAETHFKMLIAIGISPSQGDYKIICKAVGCTVAWSDEEFQTWASNITKIDDSNIAEVIAVLGYAYHLTVAKEKFFIRDHQILAILLVFKNPQGVMLEVETGGGKSAIIAIFNMIEALNELIGHTMTGTATLARRDAKKQKPFFDKFNITVGDNTIYTTEKPNPCYSKKRVYCDIRSLLADNLRNLHEFIMEVSDADSITIDEVDLPFIDQAIFRGTKIQLSSPIPGFEYLKNALQLAWSNLYNIRYVPSAIGYEYDVEDQMDLLPF